MMDLIPPAAHQTVRHRRQRSTRIASEIYAISPFAFFARWLYRSSSLSIDEKVGG